jgi:hypothetical protein
LVFSSNSKAFPSSRFSTLFCSRKSSISLMRCNFTTLQRPRARLHGASMTSKGSAG